MLGENPRQVLGAHGPAKHTLRLIVSGLVAQDGAFAGRIRARSVPWVLTPRQQVASGGKEGRRGLALRQVVVTFANHFEHVEGQVVEL